MGARGATTAAMYRASLFFAAVVAFAVFLCMHLENSSNLSANVIRQARSSTGLARAGPLLRNRLMGAERQSFRMQQDRVPKRGFGSEVKGIAELSVEPQKDEEAVSKHDILPSIIIGAGRLGNALKDMGPGTDVVLSRYQKLPENITEGPIYVATRNKDLDDVLMRIPLNRRKDLVFLQNGYLDKYLAQQNVTESTQVLVYFAVAKLGDKPLDGKTDTDPEGLTAANGPWAEEVSKRFSVGGLSCKVLEDEPFKKAMFEKLIWISSFMLIGARYDGESVGQVESNHTKEVTDVINELAAAIPDVEFDDDLADRLRAYARSVAHFPTAMKEFEWRNGYFNNLSKRAYMAGEYHDPCPLHSYHLARLGFGTPVPFAFDMYETLPSDEQIAEENDILVKFETRRAEREAARAKKKKALEEKERKEKEKAENARREMEMKEEQMTKARQLEMAKAAAEEETKRSRRKAGSSSSPNPL